MIKSKVSKGISQEVEMSKKIRNTEVDHLFDAILTLENKEECYTFLKMFVQ